jgi:PEP-CTERM motif
MLKPLIYASALLASAVSVPASAATVIDPANDFLASFTGMHALDLDVLSFSASYDASTSEFLFGAILAGVINPAKAGLYVIGVNTGAGAIAPFASIGAPNVKFDQAIVIQKNGTGLVTGGSGGPLAAAAITIVGNLFTVRVPGAFLTSTGFSPTQFGFNLWPRIGLGNNNQISDFAPNDGTFAIGAVPEPAAWMMLLAGFSLIGSAMRKRRVSVTYA